MDFAPIFSSSSGNMYLFSQDDSAIMIDMGVTGTHILNQSQRFLGDLSKLRGIFITHAHLDHCTGLLVFLDQYEEAMAKEGKSPILSVYASGIALEQIKNHCEKVAMKDFQDSKAKAREQYQGEELEDRLTVLKKRQKKKAAQRSRFYQEYLKEITGEMVLDCFHIQPITVSHDTPCFTYRVTVGESSAAVCVDLGSWDETLYQSLNGVQLLLLEANYNEGLLRKAYKGEALTQLRNRILGAFGHLSNEDAIALAEKLHQTALHTVIFGHMSSQSNTKKKLQKAITSQLGETPPFQTHLAPMKGETGDCWYDVETGEIKKL